jgi:hypothetical protein
MPLEECLIGYRVLRLLFPHTRSRMLAACTPGSAASGNPRSSWLRSEKENDMNGAHSVIRLAMLAALLVCATTVWAERGVLEFNTDRLGGDFTEFVIPAGIDNPFVCQEACLGIARCRSWTYVKATRTCFLKTTVPVATVDTCCISGKRNP